jgi:hypothetical protein
MREITTTFVGLDTHKVSISVAMLIPGEGKPVEWQCTNDRASVRRMVKVDRHHSQGIDACRTQAHETERSDQNGVISWRSSSGNGRCLIPPLRRPGVRTHG